MPTATPASRRIERLRATPRAAAGFTLIEVLVALAIVAVALMAALRGAMVLTSNAGEVERRLLAVRIAQNQLLELRFAHNLTGPGDSSFDCTQGGIDFLCLQQVTQTPNPFFRRVEIRVRSADGSEREYADLMGLVPVTN